MRLDSIVIEILERKQYALKVEGKIDRGIPYVGSGAMLKLRGKWVTTKYAECIPDAVMEPQFRAFFLAKHKFKTTEEYDTIDWHNIGAARRNIKGNQNTNVSKLIHGWLNTGRQKGHFGQSPECPCCGWHEETILHMYQCHATAMAKTRTQAFRTLERYYHHHGIPAVMYKALVRICLSTCNRETLMWFDLLPAPVGMAVQSQRRLGGDFTLRGLLSKEWFNTISLST